MEKLEFNFKKMFETFFEEYLKDIDKNSEEYELCYKAFLSGMSSIIALCGPHADLKMVEILKHLIVPLSKEYGVNFKAQA